MNRNTQKQRLRREPPYARTMPPPRQLVDDAVARHGALVPRSVPVPLPVPSDEPMPGGVASDAPVEVPHNVVVMRCASGGAGLSTLCAMLALELHERGRSCALVDADFEKGGLDVLLGLENDEGLRFGSLDIPLGKVLGESLRRQLPQWEGIGVLAFDSWHGAVPQCWEIEAVIEALARAVDVLVVDVGAGSVLVDVPWLVGARQVLLAELSVIGMARSQTLLRKSPTSHRVNNGSGGGTGGDSFGDVSAVVGIYPGGVAHGRGEVKQEEASSYLGMPLLGALRPDTTLAGDVLEGLGIKGIPKKSKRVMRDLADVVDEWLNSGVSS